MRQALHEGRDDATVLDPGRHAAGNVQEREQGRLGKELAEDLEATLTAPHPRQPVVDQGDPCARNQVRSR